MKKIRRQAPNRAERGALRENLSGCGATHDDESGGVGTVDNATLSSPYADRKECGAIDDRRFYMRVRGGRFAVDTTNSYADSSNSRSSALDIWLTRTSPAV
jgi:hypothetical protein